MTTGKDRAVTGDMQERIDGRGTAVAIKNRLVQDFTTAEVIATVVESG